MFQELRASLALLVLLMLILGVGYPLGVTELATAIFPHQAGGSLSYRDGTVIGSELIGQNFVGDVYFHGRPSAAGDGYDANNSSGSNLAPTSSDLLKTITQRTLELRSAGSGAIPVDLVTASGSGLDPDISVAGALYQMERLSVARGLSQIQLRELVLKDVRERTFGVLGENTVNVLRLNQDLDALALHE